MPGMTLEQRQQISQTQKLAQTMRLSQRQLQSLRYLAMGTEELEAEIRRQAEENPALELRARRAESTRQSDRTGIAGQLASDNFEAALENAADWREPLSSHFEQQLPFLRLGTEEERIARQLVSNLDGKGCNVLAPQTFGASARLVARLRALDPQGCFVSGYEESLFVQALLSEEEAPRGCLHILNGNLHFLEGMSAARTARLVNEYIARESRRSFGAPQVAEEQRAQTMQVLCAEHFPLPFYALPRLDTPFAEEDVAAALNFIRRLNPNPAADYSISQTHFVQPDIRIERVALAGEEMPDSIIASQKDPGAGYKVSGQSMSQSVSISADFLALAQKPSAKENAFLQKSLASAKQLIESLRLREGTLFAAAVHLARVQVAFLDEGPGHLAAFRQKDLAQALGVHESTVSRMAESKYILCGWGLFPLKYFFSKPSGSVSQDAARHAIAELVHGGAGLSDRRIAELLAERGIRIARRTVAKYRAQMDIASSFGRQEQ